MYTLDLEGEIYLFETIDQLVDMLKDEDYKITLTIKEKGKIKSIVVRL